MTHRVFGVRHHGPGSARALRDALEAWQPDAVLVEGPPDAAGVLAWAGHADMRPPVALLVHAADEPRRAVFYPFASFSPEWHALRWALARGVPVSFIDLPVAVSLSAPAPASVPAGGGGPATDPIAVLAAAAGHSDPERWWEDVIEHRRGEDTFEAVAEAMTALRAGDPPPEGREAQREASMRQHIRAAARAGHDRVAVVCGAWHVPALLELPPATHDARVLKGLPRRKVTATWVPWTHGRLSFGSGYGAGVEAPGWYHHLFTADELVVERWFAKVARLLRAEDLPAPPAAVVEAVRLARALAALRGRPLAGLDELSDAARAVLGGGSDTPMALIGQRLVVGDVLGDVPDDTPMVPLQQDLTRLRRRLRLTPAPEARALELDLRKPNDLARSHLLHRLALLDVPWGTRSVVTGAKGTFREAWWLRWDPELSVRLVEASMWGTTIEAAATAFVVDAAGRRGHLDEVTELVEQALLADLPDAVSELMRLFTDRAAVDTDVGRLMDALAPLARIIRYGNVRGTDAAAVRQVAAGTLVRVVVGLPGAASGIDDDAAAALVERVGAVHAAVALLDDGEARASWLGALHAVGRGARVHPLAGGRVTRLLLDAGELDPPEASARMSRALSRGEEPRRGAAWVEGFLAGSGLVLLHDPALLAILDAWLAGVPDTHFDEVLPLLRRTFATFPPAERRQIGRRVQRGAGAGRGDAGAEHEVGVAVDPARAAAVRPLVARFLGLDDG